VNDSNASGSRPGNKSAKDEDFFDHWATYQKAMDLNYLAHREVYARLELFIGGHLQQPFSLFDLGCGDAGFISRVLGRACVARYHGVDLSAPAVEKAKKNMAAVPCKSLFTVADFSIFVRESHEHADLIWIGLSVHHLELAGKTRFVADCRRILRKGGCLLMYEPMRKENETREEYLERWYGVCRSQWTGFEPQERDQIHEHILQSDFPETFSTLRKIGKESGFRRVESERIDPFGIHEWVCFYG
jgi:SAM-dependent methyltransferase